LGGLWLKDSPGKLFERPHDQNNQIKIDWRCGSSSRVPALQVQRPEFKSHPTKKKKGKERRKVKI
jgi:hypothetical protein